MFGRNELVQQLKEIIVLNGFEIIQKEDGVCWEKIDNDRKLSLFIGFSGSPDKYFLQTPLAFIRFYEIENKIIYYSKELGIIVKETGYTIKNKSLDNNEFNYTIFKTRIDNKEVFDKVFKSEKDYFQKSILPFFEMYQNINNVADLLANLKPQEVVPYIQGAILFVKTILILKETNHPRYEEKRDEFYSVLSKQATKKEVYKQ